MSSTVTVSLRSLLLAVGLVLALAVAYVVGASGKDQPAVAAVAATPPPGPARTITMTGTGDATGVPDQLTFTISVGNTADDVSTAMDNATGRMRAVTAALKDHGVQKLDTKTSGLSIDPVYHYYANQEPVLTGYRVRQSLDVTVRSLRGSGKALGAAIEAGGNSARVADLKLKIGDLDSLRAEAREAAVAHASEKAQQYAGAAGQALGKVVTISEVRATRPEQLDQVLYGANLSALRDTKAAVPIRAGEQTIDVDVSVVWELR
jgi:uncharacterized protein YggE